MAQENHCIALNNDVMIPQIGFGVFQVEDGPQTVDAVRTAIEDGYRHIDTASVYGNEASVGRAIAESGVDRADLFVTTKLWNDDIRKHRTKDAFQESLDRLGLDYVDLYLIHWPAEGWQEAWAAMQELYAQGRMRAIGVSNFERNHLAELLEQTDVLPAVDQVESSPTFPNQDLIDFCHGKDIAVEAWSPLGGTGGTLLTDQRLLDIGEKYGKSSAQVVLRWDLQRGVIPLPKSVHSTRIMQNIHVFDFELDESEMRIISSLDTGKRNGADPNNFDF
ncbi:aldo/keto reductase [Bifidobacterium pseudolongum]|uniref:Glyoxal reductase n=1 Tax=Bifidobacterium pseudolongum subsp. pseudolongum TaxID=31954 RepID=A0A4Q5AC85_9BIFI|nr:aldo/keto reductase [Bifidobacterium pseudolongum]KFI79608.1 Aldo/keto reductase family [Bifidobacterium pseudolongum subsp. pseudolongum]MDY3690220.1 aldo/keto reductase [Bifidobacterium pseudolongum]PKV01400.1 glyoxal reductase [Bifidobacterium pseudolongum subsp. pseudolongum]PKV08141.1 glyoxal reductase [Bifidobacterium pseudolongum subsp. pseudolongum]RYQ22243.1 glyoxal reductase [Bifidobacterium pseudolongum subsp. pseudolongum]